MVQMPCSRFDNTRRALTVCVLLAVAGAAGCRRGAPIADANARPAAASGTISGTVRGPQVANVTATRMVEAVNVTTGERRRVRTTPAGTYTFELPAGTWRIEPALSMGERLHSAPDPVALEPGQLRTDVDVTVGGQRPRTRTPEGLAPPVA